MMRLLFGVTYAFFETGILHALGVSSVMSALLGGVCGVLTVVLAEQIARRRLL